MYLTLPWGAPSRDQHLAGPWIVQGFLAMMSFFARCVFATLLPFVKLYIASPTYTLPQHPSFLENPSNHSSDSPTWLQLTSWPVTSPTMSRAWWGRMWSKGLPRSVTLLAAFCLLYVPLRSLFLTWKVIITDEWLRFITDHRVQAGDKISAVGRGVGSTINGYSSGVGNSISGVAGSIPVCWSPTHSAIFMSPCLGCDWDDASSICHHQMLARSPLLGTVVHSSLTATTGCPPTSSSDP